VIHYLLGAGHLSGLECLRGSESDKRGPAGRVRKGNEDIRASVRALFVTISVGM
jgi:hypothetical protein